MVYPALWSPPHDVVPDWGLDHPRVLMSKQQFEAARRNRENDAPNGMSQAAQRIISEADQSRWMTLDDEAIRRLVPKPFAYYMYGVTNPIGPDGTRIHPIGWDSPGLVRSEGGHIYPDEEHPDDGTGWEDGQGNRYYFVARWNGFVVDELTEALEPLAYAYALSGDIRYARKAAVILDGLATVYPTATEGPLDYPGSKPGKEGGRLERPFYQVARTLIRYVNTVDLIWDSGALDRPSAANPGTSIKHNAVYNLLLNGADYCYRELQLPGYRDQLHNGTADYMIGIVAVGSLLGIEHYLNWAIDGPTSIRYMLANNIDRDGNYFETSASYSRWTQELYMHLAELLFHVKTPRWPKGVNLYDDPRFFRFYIGNRDKNTIAGRIPSYGDSQTDEKDDASPAFDPVEWEWALRFLVRRKRSDHEEDLLQAISRPSGIAEYAYPPYSRWCLFNLTESFDWQRFPPKPDRSAADLLGGKGLAFLRSGTGQRSRGVVMRYGATLNHGQLDELGILIYDEGRELSFDPGYGMSHYRGGWQFQTVSHLTVAVDGESQLSAESSGGSVRFFAASSGLSVVDALDEMAYAKKGVKQYRRLTAWVDWSDTSSYMIDLFRVDGGRTRDYSFHGRGKQFDSENLPLSEPEPGSVANEGHAWGQRILGDGSVIDFAGKPFSFIAPGAGYGFLGAPCRGRPDGVWSVCWSEPGRLKLTMLPSAGREVIVADGPSPMGVKYVLARDTGSSPSCFASVVESGRTSGDARITQLRLRDKDDCAPSPQSVALTVASESGSDVVRDYVISTLEGEVYTEDSSVPGVGRIVTDAEFAYLRTDSRCAVRKASMIRGTVLRYGRFRLAVSEAELVGIIVSVDEALGQLRVKGTTIVQAALRGLFGYIDNEEYSHNSPYRILRSSADGEYTTIELAPNDLVLAAGKLNEAPFGNTLPNGVNLPYSRNVLRHGPNDYFTGKRVCNEKGASTVIRAVHDDYAALRVDDVAGFERGDEIRILDARAGDRFVIPVAVHWIEQSPGEYELQSPVSVLVTASAGEKLEVRKENGWQPADRVQAGEAVTYRIDPLACGTRRIRCKT